MRKIIYLLAFCFALAVGSPTQQRIVGGTETTIDQYPYMAVISTAFASVNFMPICGGTIINNRSILSAAHCFIRDSPNEYRIRVGSSNSLSGGTVHEVALVISHPSYGQNGFNNNDIGVIRVTSAFSFGNNVQAGRIAGTNYAVGDNQVVWAAGWGLTSYGGEPSEILRHVQLAIANYEECRRSYGAFPLTENMMCAWGENRGVCNRDSGGPLLHNNVVVGVTSFGIGCGNTNIPAVFARVSRYTDWIQANA